MANLTGVVQQSRKERDQVARTVEQSVHVHFLDCLGLLVSFPSFVVSCPLGIPL